MIASLRYMKVSVLQSSAWLHMVAVLLAVCFLSAVANAQCGENIRECNIDSNNTGDEGGVTTVDSPRRAGSKGFRHSIPNGRKRAEFAGDRVAVGGTYWYGWSFMHPSSPGISTGGHTILSQWFIGNRPASSWPCGGAGHKVTINSNTLWFNLQHSTNGGGDITCKKYNLAPWDSIKDKWVDVVVHAKWTANTDGFVKLWIRIGGDSGKWELKVDYKGRSQADGGSGPYFKLGAYTEVIKNGPRVVYTDEYRLGTSAAKFEDVAPGKSNSGGGNGGGGGGSTPTPTPTPTVQTLINETFPDRASVSDFTTAGGSWSVTSGQYRLTNAARDCSGPLCNRAIHNTNVTGNFTLTAQVGAVSTSGTWDDAVVIFGYKDANNYYFASFNESNDAGTNGIFKVVNGTKTQIADFSATTNSGTTLRSIKIERVGNSIKVSRDGQSLGSANDSTYTSGKVGFGTYNNSATFDNLKVTKP
jgi:hypothetical protein